MEINTFVNFQKEANSERKPGENFGNILNVLNQGHNTSKHMQQKEPKERSSRCKLLCLGKDQKLITLPSVIK